MMRLSTGRKALLRAFLPIAALLALPGLGIGALIWWRTGKTWDYRERLAGTWLLAIHAAAFIASILTLQPGLIRPTSAG